MKKPIRYIRIENTTNNTGSYPNVYWVEIEAINSEGVNVLLGKLPMGFVDGRDLPYSFPERGTDGIKDSAFRDMSSSYVNFVRYDLGEVHEDLEKILIFQNSYGSKYAKVSVSVDNLTWETILESYETITWYDSPNYYEAVVPNHIDFSTPDTTPPSFDYISDVILEHGSEFDPLHNVVALDDRDGDITNRIILVGSVDTERAGDYLLTYIVSDLSGNMTVKERHITVLQSEKSVASVELQKGLYTSLSEEYSVYEVVPKEDDFPFITFGDITRQENFTKTDKKRFTFTILIHGWSKGTSSLQSKTIEEYILNKVENIKINGFELEGTSLEMSTTVREKDADGSTIFQSIQEFNFIINQI